MKIIQKDYIKAVKIANREMELDNGFKSNHKIFVNKKKYKRNEKHK